MIEIGKKYKEWTVLRQCKERNKSGSTLYESQCKCGNIRNLTKSHLLFEHRTFMCSSCAQRAKGSRSYEDLIGQKISRWTVSKQLEPIKNSQGRFEIFFECICDCGNIANVRGAELKRGGSKCCKSCGELYLKCGLCGCRNHNKLSTKIETSECELLGFCRRCDKFCCMLCAIDPFYECNKK